jgi:hypothetical protein
MDIPNKLVDWIPRAPLYGRFAFFLIGIAVLAWYTFLYQPADIVSVRRKIEQNHAISFLLGWETMASLIPSPAKERFNRNGIWLHETTRD